MDSPQLNADIGTGDVKNISSGKEMTISKEQANSALGLGKRRFEEKKFKAAWGVQRWLKKKGAWWQARALKQTLLASLLLATAPEGDSSESSSFDALVVPDYCDPLLGWY